MVHTAMVASIASPIDWRASVVNCGSGQSGTPVTDRVDDRKRLGVMTFASERSARTVGRVVVFAWFA